MVFKKNSPSTTQVEKHVGDWPNDAGFHSPTEVKEPKELAVSGSLPGYVSGSLFRTGPGLRKVTRDNPQDGEFELQHWFDGFSHTHKFDIKAPAAASEKPRVFYQSRSQVDKQLETARRTGRLEGFTFAQKRDPCDSFFKKMKTVFEPISSKNAAVENISVAFQPRVAKGASDKDVSREITLTSDRSIGKIFDMDTLEPLGLVDQTGFHPKLTGPLSGAHPCVDTKTGTLYNYNLDFGKTATYHIFGTSLQTGETEILATINDSSIRGAYIHSMFMTENYLILCIWPSYFARMGLQVLWERNILDALDTFDPSAKTLWVVVDRKGGKGIVKKFESPAMFSFHAVNAWEEKGKDGGVDLLCELIAFDDMSVLHDMYYENIMSNGKGAQKATEKRGMNKKLQLRQYRLSSVDKPSKSKSTAELALSIPTPTVGELPTIHPSWVTKKHRFVYTMVDRGYSSFVDGVAKTDTETSTAIYWSQDKCTPGEPVFVPNPNGTAEDDGVLLVVVLNGAKGTSFLLCLDAKDLTELGRADCEVAVGLGFHGAHIPARS